MGNSAFFRVEMLPANHGDSLLLEYGNGSDPVVHRILVDGGADATYPRLRARLEQIPAPRELDLIVLTHIDGDHVGGILKLLGDPALDLTFGDLWFNGWPQLRCTLLDSAPRVQRGDTRGVVQAAFVGLKMGSRWANRWNASFNGLPIYVHEDGPLPCLDLPGGLKLTILTPSAARLRALRDHWRKKLEKKRISPDDDEALRQLLEKDRRYRESSAEDADTGDESELERVSDVEPEMDRAVANGSSISFVAEFLDRRILLLADAFSSDINNALERLGKTNPEAGLFRAIKVSHHGSEGNTDKDFMQRVTCNDFLISTNGKIFDHPDLYTLNLIRTWAPSAAMHFNYPISHVIEWTIRQGNKGHPVKFDVPDREKSYVLDLMTSGP